MSITTQAQYITITGTVYDLSQKTPLEAVAVQSSSGSSVITDSLGKYAIKVKQTDSIWFSMIGKTTHKYAINTIQDPEHFNVAIHVIVPSLPGVIIRNSSYKLDSIQNRNDYAKIFNFQKPTLRFNGGGLNVDELINIFRFKRNKRITQLQERLIEQERSKYINHRFSKAFIQKLTHLQSPELEIFIEQYKPSYEMLLNLNDLELGYYIQKCFEKYKYVQ